MASILNTRKEHFRWPESKLGYHKKSHKTMPSNRQISLKVTQTWLPDMCMLFQTLTRGLPFSSTGGPWQLTGGLLLLLLLLFPKQQKNELNRPRLRGFFTDAVDEPAINKSFYFQWVTFPIRLENTAPWNCHASKSNISISAAFDCDSLIGRWQIQWLTKKMQ